MIEKLIKKIKIKDKDDKKEQEISSQREGQLSGTARQVEKAGG